MRALALLGGASLALLLVAVACDDATKPPFLPEASPSPAAQATPTAPPDQTPAATSTPLGRIGAYDDPNDFLSFGQQLADALEERDVQFFLDNAKFEDVSCDVTGIPGPPESCAGQPPTTTVPAILVGVLQSEGYYEDAAGYEQFISEFLTTFDAGSSDSYGSAEPRLHAYGTFDPAFAPGEAETIQAIATRIVPGPVPRFPPPGRSILVFQARFAGQRWSITGLLIGGDPFSLAQFLDPTGPAAMDAAPEPLFQFWERWEGNP